MNILCKSGAIGAMLLSFVANATNLSGELTSSGLRWYNASAIGSTIIPHGWVNTFPDAVFEWQPSIPSVPSKLILTHQGNSSTSIEVAIGVTAIEYASLTGTQGNALVPGSATKNGAVFTMGNSVGANLFNGTLEFDGIVRTPFTQYRPTLTIRNIEAALRGKPNGVYQGQIAMSLPVVYRRNKGEQVTYRSIGAQIPVQIVNRSVTCRQINPPQEIKFGIVGADTLKAGTANVHDIPFRLQCDNSLSFAGMTIRVTRGQDASIASRAIIKASNHDNVGIELLAGHAWGGRPFSIGIEMPFIGNGSRNIFPSNETDFDLSFKATPVAIQPELPIEYKGLIGSIEVTTRYN